MAKDDSGFVIPMIVTFGLLIVAMLLATSTRSWIGLKGSIRKSEANRVKAIAEAGMLRVMESLNTDYPHLLVIDNDNWDTTPLSQGICPNSTATGSPATVGLIGSDGKYELEKYDYKGTFYYGGEADIRMRGEILKGPNEAKSAVSIVEQTVQIKPKTCDEPIGAPPQGTAGLLAQRITMCGNDLKGRLNGNLFCTDCIYNIPQKCSVDSSTPLADYSISDKICVIGGNENQTEIDGDINLSILAFPPVPVPPIEMNDLYDNPPNIETTTTIVGGSDDPSELLSGACRSETETGITHCVVNNINLSGSKTLTINTTGDNPVHMYVDGDSVDFRGKSGMIHISDSALDSDSNSNSSIPTNFGFFGRPIDPTNQYPDQSVILRGRGNAINMWVYFPDGNLGIKGGAGDDVKCDSEGLCTGGDIYGAVWAKTWGQSCGTGAAIVVPENMGKLLNEKGSSYDIGTRDYVAIGVSKWKSFIVDSQ